MVALGPLSASAAASMLQQQQAQLLMQGMSAASIPVGLLPVGFSPLPLGGFGGLNHAALAQNAQGNAAATLGLLGGMPLGAAQANQLAALLGGQQAANLLNTQLAGQLAAAAASNSTGAQGQVVA